MAINSSLLRRPSDRALYLFAAVGFPLLIFIGYFKSYYFSHLFDVKPMSVLVHAHGIVMTLWVIYFTAQITLIRTKNIRLHMTLGMAGIALAFLVVVIGMATAYNRHILQNGAPPGIDPHAFFIVPTMDMLLFVIFLTGAIYYRKRRAEHKSLMLMTAINFLPPAFGRIHVLPDKFGILWAWGAPSLLALVAFSWHARKHSKANKIFLAAALLLIASYPLRFFVSGTQIWLEFTGWLASLG